MKIKIIKPMIVPGGMLSEGRILEAREYPSLGLFPKYQVVEEGPFIGQSIPYDNCFVLPEERTYTEAEYVAVHQELLRRREQVKELEGEREKLLQQIERSVDEQKPVVLPREVAEAINICKNAGLMGFEIITSIDRVSSLFRGYSKPVLNSLVCIRDYAWKNQARILMALVNGYVVEDQTSPLALELAGMIREWVTVQQARATPHDNVILARQILKRLSRENEAKSG